MKKVVLILIIFIMAIMTWSIITSAEEPIISSNTNEWANNFQIQSFVNNAEDVKKQYQFDANNTIIRLRTKDFFKTNPSIYCFEPNTQLIGDPMESSNSRKNFISVIVKEGIEVENDEFAYIANTVPDVVDTKKIGVNIFAEEDFKQEYKDTITEDTIDINNEKIFILQSPEHFNFNIKQNLIWSYINAIIKEESNNKLVDKLKELDNNLAKHYINFGIDGNMYSVLQEKCRLKIEENINKIEEILELKGASFDEEFTIGDVTYYDNKSGKTIKIKQVQAKTEGAKKWADLINEITKLEYSWAYDNNVNTSGIDNAVSQGKSAIEETIRNAKMALNSLYEKLSVLKKAVSEDRSSTELIKKIVDLRDTINSFMIFSDYTYINCSEEIKAKFTELNKTRNVYILVCQEIENIINAIQYFANGDTEALNKIEMESVDDGVYDDPNHIPNIYEQFQYRRYELAHRFKILLEQYGSFNMYQYRAQKYKDFAKTDVKLTQKAIEVNGDLKITLEGMYGDFEKEIYSIYMGGGDSGTPNTNYWSDNYDGGVKIILVKNDGSTSEYNWKGNGKAKNDNWPIPDPNCTNRYLKSKLQTITIPASALEGVSDVKIEVYKTRYAAKIYPLIPVNSTSQKLIYIDSKEVTDTYTWTHSFESTDVSMQKYITAVYEGEEKQEITGREDLYAKNDINVEGYNHLNKGIKINIDSKTEYKYNTPVAIKKDDIVEYTITVYNNDTSKIARNVTITDEIYNPNNSLKLSVVEEGKEVTNENNLIINGNVEITTEGNSATLIIKVGDIKPSEEKTYKVYIQYNSFLDGITTNKAWISSDNKSTKYRTYDEDYIYMPSVSIQKYITKVNNTVIRGRENKKATSATKDPIYKSTEGKINSSGEFKNQDPVNINEGDIVIYTIQAYNNTCVENNNVEIEDIFNKDLGGELIEIVSDVQYQCEENTPTKLENIIIPAYGNVIFKIYMKYDRFVNEIIENKVTITCPKNNENYRTEDADYVKMVKITNVSIQKYITKVNETVISGRQNRWADTDKNLEIVDEYNHYNKHISKKVTSIASNKFKSADPELIEIGDKVEYTIIVYNNNHSVSDKFDIIDKYKGILVSIKEEDELLWTPKDKNNVNIEVDELNSKIKIKNIVLDGSPTYDDFRTFKICVQYNSYVEEIIENIVYISSQGNKSIYRTYDEDYVKMQNYNVSLQKIVYYINGKTEGIPSFNRWDSWECEDKIKTDKESAYKKYNNPVTVEYGDTITYAIKVKNNGNTNVKNIKISDEPPKNVVSAKIVSEKSQNNHEIELQIDYNTLNYTIVIKGELKPGEEEIVYITKVIKASNTSVEVYRNYAKITDIQNRNDISVKDIEITPYDNEDADYFQTKDIIISGMVWNDKVLNKTQDKYNGLFDKGEENNLSDIKVYLYRQEVLDVNGDGRTDSTDKARLYNYYMSKFMNNNPESLDLNCDGNYDDEIDKYLADFNGDGEVDLTDYLLYKNAYIIDGANPQIARKVAEAITDKNGEYKFELNYIKGPKKKGTDRWLGKHYLYFVVFEYDGIMYTSTPDGKTCVDINNLESHENGKYKINSNAKEGVYSNELALLVTRQELNNKYSTINNRTDISYTTENESGFIPKSKYTYNENDNKIHSSTNLIDISKVSEEQLKYVNLGLRGRDTFDLSLISNVDNIKVTVNGVSGVYTRNSVSLRDSDINAQDEDMANIKNEEQNTYVLEDKENNNQNINKPQYIRKNDIYNDKYINTGLNIQVTYKITIKNESITQGAVTKLVNYYDPKYSIERENVVYYIDSNNNTQWISMDNIKDGTSGDNYKSLEIIIPEKILNQGDTYDIYVVYQLNNPAETLKVLLGENAEEKIPTYNMSEIAEYKTVTTTYKDGTNNEAIRGLIDKDSAPGSANKEQVRLISTQGQSTSTIGGNLTTVEYYFNKQNLSDLKYEDDTYVAPVLYFALPSDEDKDEDEIPDYSRAIVGNVFRDETKINAETKIKTGNGKLDEGEAPVYGATVELIEVLETEGNIIGTIRNTTTTDKNGYFKFVDFLPGNYIIRYHYGDTANTVLIKQNGNVNAYSFNGEDYQSTNNSIEIDGMDTNKLSEISNFWYVYNEKDGISTATDDPGRREEVIKNVLSKEDNNTNKVITLLNLARKGNLTLDELNGELPNGTLIEQTKMFADTPPMYLELEKRQLNTDGALWQDTKVGKYKITNMNFGIAEVPVTTIDLQKFVKAFTITDASRQNVIAKVTKISRNEWKIEGNVTSEGRVHASIEDQKLQGAYLQITYGIKANIDIEKNYDNTNLAEGNIVIKDLVDIVDNNLSYNAELQNNSDYWEVIQELEKSSIENISLYNTFVKAKEGVINKLNAGEEITITLEKVLTSNSTLEQIINSTVDSYVYKNTVEITGWDTSIKLKDRIRNKDRYIIIPCVQHDTATSEEIVITPPAGDSSIHTVYYILAAISLGIIGVGVFVIKKYALKD